MSKDIHNRIVNSLWSCLVTLGYCRNGNHNVSEKLQLIQKPNGSVIDKTIILKFVDGFNFCWKVETKIGKEYEVITSSKTYDMNTMFQCFQDIVDELRGPKPMLIVYKDVGHGSFRN